MLQGVSRINSKPGSGSGTIGGNISATYLAYGSGVDTITGDALATRDPSTGFTNIAALVGTGQTAGIQINENLLGIGFGISGVASYFSDTTYPGIFATSLLAQASPIDGGDPGFFTLFGVLNATGGIAASFQGLYDVTDDSSNVTIKAQNSTAHQAQIQITANSSNHSISLNFGGGANYSLPNTAPSSGQFLGWTGSNTTGWVTPSGGGGTVTGTGVSGEIAYWNSTTGITSDANFVWSNSGNTFNVGSSSQAHFGISGISMTSTIGALGTYHIVDSNGNTIFSANTLVHPTIAIGDINSAYDGTKLVVNDASGTQSVTVFAAQGFNVEDTSSRQWMVIDPASTGPQIAMGDLNASLHDTTFLLSDISQYVQFNNRGHGFLAFDYAGETLQIGDISATIHGGGLNIAYSTALSQLGDYAGNYQSTVFSVDDLAQIITAQATNAFTFQNISGERWLYISPSGLQAFMGDLDDSNNHTLWLVDDNAQQGVLTAQNGLIVQQQGSAQWLNINPNSFTAGVGDLSGEQNNTKTLWDDTAESITEQLNGTYTIQNAGSNVFFEINQSTTTAYFGDASGSWGTGTGMKIQVTGGTDGVVTIGDIVGNNTHFVVDQNNETLSFGNSGFQILFANTALGTSYLVIGDTTSVQNKTQLIVNDFTQAITFSFGTAGAYTFPIGSGNGVLTNTGGPDLIWGNGQLGLQIANATNGGTINLVDNAFTAVNNSVAAVTINFPSSPANGDVVELKFEGTVGAITYTGGTIHGTITSSTPGLYQKWQYNSTAGAWF